MCANVDHLVHRIGHIFIKLTLVFKENLLLVIINLLNLLLQLPQSLSDPGAKRIDTHIEVIVAHRLDKTTSSTAWLSIVQDDGSCLLDLIKVICDDSLLLSSVTIYQEVLATEDVHLLLQRVEHAPDSALTDRVLIFTTIYLG